MSNSINLAHDAKLLPTAAQVNQAVGLSAKTLQRKYTTGFYKDVKGDAPVWTHSLYPDNNKRIYFSKNPRSSVSLPTTAFNTVLALAQLAYLNGPKEKGYSTSYLFPPGVIPPGGMINTSGRDYMHPEATQANFAQWACGGKDRDILMHSYVRTVFNIELLTHYDGQSFPNGVNGETNLAQYDAPDLRDSALHAAVMSHITIPTMLQSRIIPHSFEPQRFDNIDTSPGAAAPPLECCTWDPGDDTLPHYDYTYDTNLGDQCRNMRTMELAYKWWAMYLMEIIPFFSSSSLARPLHFSYNKQLVRFGGSATDYAPFVAQRLKIREMFREFNSGKKLYHGTSSGAMELSPTSSNFINSYPAVGKYAVDLDFGTADIASFFLPPLYEFWSKDDLSYGNHPKVREWRRNNPFRRTYMPYDIQAITPQAIPVLIDKYYEKFSPQYQLFSTGVYPLCTYSEPEHFSFAVPIHYHNRHVEFIKELAMQFNPAYNNSAVASAFYAYFNQWKMPGIWIRDKGLTRWCTPLSDPKYQSFLDPLNIDRP